MKVLVCLMINKFYYINYIKIFIMILSNKINVLCLYFKCSIMYANIIKKCNQLIQVYFLLQLFVQLFLWDRLLCYSNLTNFYF